MARENLNQTEEESRENALTVLNNAAANKFNEMITAFQKNPGSVEGDTLFAEFCGHFSDGKINSVDFFLNNVMDKNDKDNYDKVKSFRDDKDLIEAFNGKLQKKFANAICEYFNSKANVLLNQLKDSELKKEVFDELDEKHKKLSLVVVNTCLRGRNFYEKDGKVSRLWVSTAKHNEGQLIDDVVGANNGLNSFLKENNHFLKLIHDYSSPISQQRQDVIKLNKQFNEEFALKKLEFALKSENQLSLADLIKFKKCLHGNLDGDLNDGRKDDALRKNEDKIINFMASKVGCLYNSTISRTAKNIFDDSPNLGYLKKVIMAVNTEIDRRKEKIAEFIQQKKEEVNENAKSGNNPIKEIAKLQVIKEIAKLQVGDILEGHDERRAKKKKENQIRLVRKDLKALERATEGFIKSQLEYEQSDDGLLK